jgi:hypothetical protein
LTGGEDGDSDGARWSVVVEITPTGQSTKVVKSVVADRSKIAESIASEKWESALKTLELSTKNEDREIEIAEKSNASCRSSRIEMNSKK